MNASNVVSRLRPAKTQGDITLDSRSFRKVFTLIVILFSSRNGWGDVSPTEHAADVSAVWDYHDRCVSIHDMGSLTKRLNTWALSHPEDAEGLYVSSFMTLSSARGKEFLKGYELELRKSAALGFPAAKARLGYYLRQGFITPRDETMGDKLLNEAIAENCADGFVLKALILDSLQDPAALESEEKLLHRAAELGHIPAHRALAGVLVRQGRGAKAQSEMESGADGGDPEAMRDLGIWREQGMYGPRDADEAFRLFRRAAPSGDPAALEKLGECYRDSIGTERDADRAIEYFNAAAERGNISAKYSLSQMYLTDVSRAGDAGTGVKLLEESAAAGFLPAQITIGKAYLEGVWVERDIKKSGEWFERAVRQKSPEAAIYLKSILDVTKAGVSEEKK